MAANPLLTFVERGGKKNENTFLRDIFIATHFFVKLQQVTQKDLIQHFKVAVQWAF